LILVLVDWGLGDILEEKKILNIPKKACMT
jgi:hypothetical protein